MIIESPSLPHLQYKSTAGIINKDVKSRALKLFRKHKKQDKNVYGDKIHEIF